MSEELVKHSINLKPGQMERLKELHPEVGASMVIRILIDKYLSKFDTDDKPTPIIEVDI